MGKKIKVGVLGAFRGEMMIKFCNQNDECKLVAVCDKNEMLLTKIKKAKGVTCYTDFDEFIKHDMDAVVLANCANEHVPFAIKSLNAGKHVLSEVLAVASLKEAVDLIEAVERTGLVYSYAENYCYMPAVLEMTKLYKEGKIGELEYAEGEYLHNCEPIWPEITYGDPNHWRNNMSATFYCTHSIGPLLYVTGLRPVSVTGFELPFSSRTARMGQKSGTAGSKTNHGWDGGTITTAATCTTNGVKTYTCATCKKTKTETITKLGHDFSASWTTDGTNHWHVCNNGCGTKDSNGTHVWDNACDTNCNVCGKGRSITHDYTLKTINNTYLKSAATCTSPAVYYYACSECGAKGNTTYTNGEALGHNYSGAWVSDGNGHWKECSRDNCSSTSQTESHVWDNTCDTNCNVCNYERAIEHTFGSEIIYDETHHWTKCDVCGANNVKEEHVMGVWNIITPPSLNNQGTEGRDCNVCDYHEERGITALNSASLTLKETIGVNFYLDATKYTTIDGAYVELTYNHNKTDYDQEIATDKVMLNSVEQNGDGTFKFSISFASGQIADNINIRLFNEKKELVYQKENYSVKAYCDAVIASSSDTGLVKICQSIINYGMRAIEYFEYKTNLPNTPSSYIEDIQGAPTQILESNLANISISENASGIKILRYSFIALSDTSIRIYFDMEMGDSIRSYEVELIDKPQGSSMDIKLGSNGIGHFVEVYGIESINIDNSFTVTVKKPNESNQTTITYNALKYLYDAIEKIGDSQDTKDVQLKNMCLAIYQYNYFVEQYWGNI